MRLNGIELIRLLPHFMQDERNSKAFAHAIQGQLNKVSANIEYANIYCRVDEMSEELLDELAWQFNIPEYNIEYAIDVKRELIKTSLIIHHQRGTVGAVERVVQSIFGTATLEEWFDYGGKPYHFKVRTTNTEASDEMLADLERVIIETQNIRSHLEEVVVELMQSMSLYVGCIAIIMDEVTLKTTDIY